MIVSHVLRPRRAIGVLVLVFATLGISGCGGGWGEAKPTINASITKGTQTVSAGQTATLSVSPLGTGPFTYQWYRNGVAISGATSSTYSSQVTGADNGAIYTVQVSNAGGSVTSSPYTLTVNTPPTITGQPGSETVTAGQAASFTITASGTGPLSYQWYRDGSLISGATSSTFTDPATSVSDNGSQITVLVTNALGSITSSTATLSVLPAAANLAIATIPAQTYGSAPFAVSTSSASNGALTYQVVSGPATVAGSTVTITGAGDVVLSVTQAASGNYSASTATTTVHVSQGVPSLSFASVPAPTYGAAAFPVSATSASTGPVTYSLVSGPATVSSGGIVTVTGAGIVVLVASQAATANYTAATAHVDFNVTAATPTLSFASVPAQTFGNPPFAVSASSNSTGPITYSVVSGPATISASGGVTVTGAGTVVLAASQAATANYAATTVNTSFNVASATPTLTFNSVPSITYGAAAFPISASSASSGTVTYNVVSGPATVTPSGTVTVTGAGTVVFTARQAATANYAAATASTSLNVATATPTLTFATPPAINFGSAAFPVSATSASSGAVTYSVVSGPATITPSGTVTVTGAGTVVLAASQAATANYAAATANVSINVAPATPTLAFTSIPSKIFGTAPFPVSATSASSGTVTYSVVSGPATVSPSGTVTFTGTGTVVLAASQAATANYAATTANTSFSVTPATPSLTFTGLPSLTFGAAPASVSATSASNGAVTYSVVSGPATITPGGTLTITGAGTIVLSASQAATANYTAASTGAVLTVAPAVPSLSFVPISTTTYGATAPAVSATSISNGAVRYSVVSGPATITPGGTLTIAGAGTVVLAASQAATANYTAATADTSFTVAPATPTLSFTTIPSKVFGAAAFPVSATSLSNGAVTYSVVSGPATIVNGSVTISGTGTVVLAASQAATANYAAATANTSFAVTPASTTLSLGTLANVTYGAAPFTISASSNSPALITYSLVSGPATVSPTGAVTITGAGSVVLGASQPATANYAAATTSTSLTVNPAVPNLTFTTVTGKTYGNPAFTVGTTSPSSGVVTYSVASGPASITPGGIVTLTGAGPVVLSASQAANGNYASATASTTFTVAPNVSISPITPISQVLAPGQLTFNATAVGGQTNSLIWTATGGSFTGSTWTTPNVAGTYTIRATSVDQPTVFVTTTATVSAPVITTQPASQNVCTSASATLSVAANYGSTYQWSLGGTALPGANSSSYFIAGAASLDAGNYTATVSNPAGSVTSSVGKVVVGSSLTSNPANLSIFATQTASFSVSVSGIGPFTYKWYRVPSGGSPVLISGATSSTYITAAISLGNSADQYYATVTDGCGTVLTSTHATLTVTNANVPPTITTQPLGVSTVAGGSPTFLSAASGTPSLSYQWYRIPAGSVTGSAVSGATSATYTVPPSMTTTSNDQDQYYLLVTNSYGQAVSQYAPLVVGNGVLIQITDQPGTVYVNAGAPSTFSVTATSALPLSYQWYKAAPGSSAFAAISGATSSTYTLTSPANADTGSVYHVVVSNGVTTSVTSSSASLFVGTLASIPTCSTGWSMLGNTIVSGSCGYQLTAATTSQFGEIVWPTLISTGNIRLAFTIATSNPSSPPADGFAMVLGDPSLGATLTSQGQVGEGLGARGIPGFVLAFDDFYNSASGSWPQDPTVPYLGVGRGETALWENPYFNVNSNIPQLAAAGQTISHAYIVTIVQSQMTVTMDGTQVFSGRVSVPPVAYLYVTSSTGGSWEQTVISNISATVSAPSN